MDVAVVNLVLLKVHMFPFSVHWLDHDKTLREQGVDDTHTVLLRYC